MILKLIEADFQQRVANHQQSQNAGSNDQPAATHNLSADGESATQQVLGRIFTTPSDSVRAVMFLNDSDLKDRYLTGKGEQKIVDAATDDQIAAIFPHANFQLEGGATADESNSFLFEVKDFDLTSLDKPLIAKRPYAVILNVPRNIAQHFETKTPTDIADARKVLVEIISHKNYVATLNANAIKKSGVGALEDRDEREEKFNIKKFITAFPVRALIDAARAEQDEKDRQTRVTPNNDGEEGGDSQPAPVPLTGDQIKVAKKIAHDAAVLYFKASARINSAWPTTAEGAKDLRQKIVDALTKDSRMGGDTHMIPTIVRIFHKRVKDDDRYPDLIKLLQGDQQFMKQASGELTDDEPGTGGTDEPSGDQQADEQPADDQAGTETETPVDKTADELAAEIKAKGEDYADEVAKILARKQDAVAASSTPNLPDDVKAEIDRLTKIKNNAINPKQREKAATEIARLIHQAEEKQKKRK